MPAPGLETYRADETAYHDELVNDGGRPAYPISLLKDVSTKPTKYSDMVSIWHTDKGDWRVFRTQLKRWKNFRVWQKDNRNINEDDAEWEAHVEFQQRFLGWHHVANRAHWQGKRDARRDRVREPEAIDLLTYVEAVKTRLAYHGFTVPPQFQLDQDPKRQDTVTTWIEYLCFSYWWVDSQRSHVRDHKPKYDYYWTKLKESGLLRPSEAEDYVWAFIHAQARQLELDAVRRQVESAAAALEQLKGDKSESPAKGDEPGSPVKSDEPGPPVKSDEPGPPVKSDESGSQKNGDEPASHQDGDEPSHQDSDEPASQQDGDEPSQQDGKEPSQQDGKEPASQQDGDKPESPVKDDDLGSKQEDNDSGSQQEDNEPSPDPGPDPAKQHAFLLQGAQAKYEQAIKYLQFVERRAELFRDLEDNGKTYWDGKVILGQMERAAGWVLEQVQLLMVEPKRQSTLNKAEKRKRDRQDKKGPKPKKRKVGKQQDKQDKQDGSGHPLRRSARISAMQGKRAA